MRGLSIVALGLCLAAAAGADTAPSSDSKDKTYPSGEGRSRARMREAPRTTLFDAHSRELLPLFRTPPPAWLVGRFFRCRGFAVEHGVDPRLVELLARTGEHFHAPRVVVVSGYRSPKFNDYLYKKCRHVASESWHTKGEAVDFRVPGVPLKALHRWVQKTHTGGVGIYPNDGFVHADLGPPRQWVGK